MISKHIFVRATIIHQHLLLIQSLFIFRSFCDIIHFRMVRKAPFFSFFFSFFRPFVNKKCVFLLFLLLLKSVSFVFSALKNKQKVCVYFGESLVFGRERMECSNKLTLFSIISEKRKKHGKRKYFCGKRHSVLINFRFLMTSVY